MTLEEAVKLWVNRDFSFIPTCLVLKAYKDNPDELELLSSEYPEYAYPCAHGWMFHPEFSLDEEWIRENIEDVEACSFLVYDSERNRYFACSGFWRIRLLFWTLATFI